MDSTSNFLAHVDLVWISKRGSFFASSILTRASKNRFNAIRQKRSPLAAQFEESDSRNYLYEAAIQGRSQSVGSCLYECLNGAFCSAAGTCDCQIFQALGERCQIVPNTGKERDGICKTWGQYHFETFDGIYYYFPGNCSYILAKDCGAREPQYTVWVHNSPKCIGSVYYCRRSVSLFFSSQEEILISGHEVKKDGIRLILPQTIGHVSIEKLADYILVKTNFGFSLAWDGISGIYIKLSEEHKGKTTGLCGNYNGIQSDDLQMQHGKEATEDVALFANSWSVQTAEDVACIDTASDFPNPCSTGIHSFEVIFFKCQILLQFPFLSCHEYIDPYSYIASCINDLCNTNDDHTYCRAATEYARACSHVGYPIQEWRDDFPACVDKCDDSLVHRDCISCCPPTCTFEKECLGSNLHCLDGCYCPDGLIMDNGTCVALEKCPCSYRGLSYSVGSIIEQECSECVCVGGTWNCTKFDCPVECSVVGDSHFTTFDGRHYTFFGVCQYILVKGTGKDKFTITLQQAPCDENLDWACLQSVALVLEDDFNKQVILNRGGEILTGPNQGFNLNGHVEIRNLSSLFIILKTRFGLKILFAKDGARVYIQLGTDWKRRTMGLCGTFNGNIRDDFMSPGGMIEGTPQLHGNAWKVSSACFAPVRVPLLDPCTINQENIGFAAHCDVIHQELFAPCHDVVSPGLYYQLCRFDACKCGSPCLCNALGHYAYVCGKHGIFIDFRAQVSFCAVVCQKGMLYHPCSSFCHHSCASLSSMESCDDDCVEGCNCPEGKYFDEVISFCVPIFSCHCEYRGSQYQPGELVATPTGLCQCLNGTVRCAEPSPAVAVHTCPEGKRYFDCKFPDPELPASGVNCETTCINLAMNFTCSPSPPCASGCLCPPGMAEHKGKCYVPESCPCLWKDWEYLSGEVISTPCYTCVCRRGMFNCTYYPCPAVCTIYGDRHYHSFDGLEFDYVSDCQAFLVKSADDSEIAVIAQNKKCFDNDIICSKSLLISVGDTEIYLNDSPYKQKRSGFLENKPTYQLWKAGYYAVVYFPEKDITILWDKKTTIHIKVGSHWKGKLSGLCGNFDKCSSNDMTTSNNMEVRSPQVFGESWSIGQCENPNETVRPCEAYQNKFPYAKKECSILYSDIFAPCRNVIDVTSFVKNCHTDTCNCNLGGDCECLCSSIAAYAYKCCQEGVSVHWRGPICALDCESYNQGLGEGPYILASYGSIDAILGANITSRKIFPLRRTSPHDFVFFSFMITPGLFREKKSTLSLVSLESAERPNYFLFVHEDDTISLERWEANSAFRRNATFFHHQGLWIPGFSAFELHSKKGFFITFTDSTIKVSKYDDSDDFKHASSFTMEEIPAAVPYRRMCEWRYEPCATPCFKTCSDPDALACKFLPPVEGCLPYCPRNMILDEVTLKCVYPADCIPVPVTEAIIKPPQPVGTGPPEPHVPSDCPEEEAPTPASECVPEYMEPTFTCYQYVCINKEWVLFNLSSNCPKDTTIPDCGFRGMPVQVNNDTCCPEWECPCRCSMLSELSIITFDGNSAALYSMASYILVQIPGEIIIAHIEKCPSNHIGHSKRKLVSHAKTSGLCFKKLNITLLTHNILINRITRKVEVDSIVVPLPFSENGLSIEDTGAMYVVNTPGRFRIRWAHVTGIIDIHYDFSSIANYSTEGLCGVCNDDPDDDLRMQNGTIITNMDDIGLFIESWELDKLFDVTTRRPVKNCTEDDCSHCVELLNKTAFIPCHKKVLPEEFCEKMWINYTYFWKYECDVLSAYVALCNKYDICIQWRTSDYCSLSCPEGMEYQPCAQSCTVKTCQNKWFFEEESSCQHLREDCVCTNGTILHRPDSILCIQEEKCACTDNKGQPRTSGEIWNGSDEGCCLYECLENGNVIPLEPSCIEELPPTCEREGEVVITIMDMQSCCPKKLCACDMTLCETDIPMCKSTEKLFVGYSPLHCCPQYQCECDILECPEPAPADCREDQFEIQVQRGEPCCYSPFCVCEPCTEPIPLCTEGEFLTVDLHTTHLCCPQFYCVCEQNLCSPPSLNCPEDMKLVKENVSGQCCPEWHCECSCENIVMPTCNVGELTLIDQDFQSDCGCQKYLCEKDNVCVFQEVNVLNPGESMIKYLEGDYCYPIECLEEKDNSTGYHAMNISMVNCSKECEEHQEYVPSTSDYDCCGSCKNVSCSFKIENDTFIYEEGSSWVFNCSKYECVMTDEGTMILGYSVVCPPFNETECKKNEGIITIINDGCCKICRREERMCQKITVKTTIKKQDCTSQSPISVASCDGKCPSATIYNVNIDNHFRFCKCCRESGVRNVNVPLFCSGNGSEVTYTFQEPIECSCQWK
ncbi:otogelin-like protein isoform X1 [Monodelphis domestica]|uniref:otogelin-like protein isoform X1 n=1 Tax=Monodelphis domestica TaxID=13616 RepID=UPI0024E1AE6F|nr:otogelin-like protein isoform X1 [Monodelphis domestica]